MKRPISRVILSGVVGVVSAVFLTGCTPECDDAECDVMAAADPTRVDWPNESMFKLNENDRKYTKIEAAIAREAIDTGAELVYILPSPAYGPRFAIQKVDEQGAGTANDSKSTQEGAALTRKALDTGAELEIQKINEQATETAVEAYTEEPRWDGASEYSQACSPSSGDLGCD